MDDKLNNNQEGSAELTTNEVQANVCPECKKSPCVCSGKSSDSHQEVLNKENSSKTKRPRISWI